MKAIKKKVVKKKLRVLIVAKQNKLGLKMAKKLERKLSEYTDEIHFDVSTTKSLSRAGKKGIKVSKFHGDLIITIGGDGTLLWTAHQTNIPILPVRIEGHGFLCTAEFNELIKNLDRIKKKNYIITERLRIKCTKAAKGKIEKYFDKFLHREYPYSMNEIVFTRRRPSKILEIEFKIDDTIYNMRGDGILFSTPLGSSAYSASAGGSLIDPSLDVIAIVPLYAFHSKIRPMVVSANKKIEVRIKGGDTALIIDGHGGEYLKSGSDFIIEKGEPMKVISFSDYNFYKRFKNEFMGLKD